MSVKKIKVNAKKTINNLEVRMGEFAPGIEPTSVKPRGQVFKYMEITANQNLSDSVDSLTFSFTVPLEWIGFQGATPQDVKLYRFVNNNWVQLQTRYVKQEGTEAHYEATTPGLSYFAITSGLDILSTIKPEEPFVDLEPTTAPERVAPVQEQIRPMPEPSKGKGWQIFFGLFVVVIAGVIVALFFFNRKSQMEKIEYQNKEKTEVKVPKKSNRKGSKK